MWPPYAELHCISNFTFLRGASHPEELVTRAIALGYTGLALTDECSLAGVVRAHAALRARDPDGCGSFNFIVGTELHLSDGPSCVLLATDRASYGRLSALITHGRRGADKGRYSLDRCAFKTHLPGGCLALWLPGPRPDPEQGAWLHELFPGATWIASELLRRGDDQVYLQRLQRLAKTLQLPLCASGNVHMHRRRRRVLQDTLTAIRMNQPLHRAGLALNANGERYLRPREHLARLYPEQLLHETVHIAAQCRFSLDELRYEYPRELVPDPYTASEWLTKLTWTGAARRWPGKVPDKVRKQITHELALIEELHYEPYFLTVHDVVHFARQRGILCQGRGSAANSAVCYCLHITEVDPARMDLLFERFISRERDEPPDIDVDFEHERREEVIQYIYNKYGRERAALAATVICYRPRSAIRDVGKALGLDLAQVDRLARSVYWWDEEQLPGERVRELGFDPDGPLWRRFGSLVSELIGFPRHLSQHVGGFVIAEERLSQLVPIENAAMPERTVIQWDKDDLETLGLLKVDVLGLGMLSAIRKTLSYLSAQNGAAFTMDQVPAEDPRVYAMMQQADTVGVFQIESRAQMAMLPRLKPRCFYDLVIEIAIVRPGPIQGEMVHPYLRRRSGREAVTYPGPEVKRILQRTLGVPIFQEQVMKLAVVAAGFTPGEADQLRRSMAAWRRRGGLEQFQQKLLRGMHARGYAHGFAQQICNQIKGFGEYGFPESHSASFALLAYVSAWLKCHHPAAFTCGLLNSLPMGFYGPSQLVQDARRHGVIVLPADVQHSDWDCGLETLGGNEQPALRLGLRLVKGLSRDGACRLVAARDEHAFSSVADLKHRAGLKRHDLECLAAADALATLAGHRHQACWSALGVEEATGLWTDPGIPEAEPLLRVPGKGDAVVADYASMGLSLRHHPLALLRKRLRQHGVTQAQEFHRLRNGAVATAAGLPICRQRPGSASGVIFITLEDETGVVNVVVWPAVAQAQRRPLLQASLLLVTGTVQQEQGVLHLIAGRLQDRSEWLGGLRGSARDFH